MKTYNTIEEINADIVDGVLKVDDDITITFDCKIQADIKALDINAMDIKAFGIMSGNITAMDIDAMDINARDIDARDIKAQDIDAMNIKAGNITYYGVCIAYGSFKCKSIKGRRNNSIHKCLDQDIEFIKEAKKELEEARKQLREVEKELEEARKQLREIDAILDKRGIKWQN